MADFDLYRDLAERTHGDFYLGVVGPVRTGKSTFIQRFMEVAVLPRIQNEADRARALDALPQSAAGRTIMTTEPKFVPDQAVEIEVDENARLRVRLVDCVGYTVEGARGYEDEAGIRMVHTPWLADAVPFQQAAEIGTHKVINDHATIGIVVTTDGSIGELPREAYQNAEGRVVKELQESGKPFVIVLNSVHSQSADTTELAAELSAQYQSEVVPLDVSRMGESEVNELLKRVLYEFPVRELSIVLPKWVGVLDDDHWVRRAFSESIETCIEDIHKLRDVKTALDRFQEYEVVANAELAHIDLGDGAAEIALEAPTALYDRVLTEVAGVDIQGQDQLLRLLRELTEAKKQYDRIADALKMCEATGYGVVRPKPEEMTLEKPEVIRNGTRYGIKLRATASSIHMLRVDVTSEFSPIVGTEDQSQRLLAQLQEDLEQHPEKVWDAEYFGKSLYAIVSDGIESKLAQLPLNAQEKLRETLERIVNEGSAGLIAILL
ncbi:MAG: stage IV sporulation protein A [Firmicutes bacterium]|nr:stage IV sporulation protein A [Bacillota bacterium]